MARDTDEHRRVGRWCKDAETGRGRGGLPVVVVTAELDGGLAEGDSQVAGAGLQLQVVKGLEERKIAHT